MAHRISRDEAWSLLAEWVTSESLRRHCLAVEAAMRAYAVADGHDEELWAVTGLLHDADYERFPDMDDTERGHPRTIMAELQRRDAPPEMVRAIASHADFLHVSRDSPLERTLYAVDELSGFLLACAYVRPEGIHGLTPKSVKKKLKQPSFAAAVNREDVRRGAEELGVDLDEHVRFVIAALEPAADGLELTGATLPPPADPRAMTAPDLRAVQAPLKERYATDPDAARITLSAAGTLGDGVSCSVHTGRALAEAGLHPATGGDGSLLCSGDMLLEALVACAGVTLRAVATSLGIAVTAGAVRAEGELDFRGTLAVDREAPVGFSAIRLSFELDTDADEEQLATLCKLTERYCVVYQTLRGGPELSTSVAVA